MLKRGLKCLFLFLMAQWQSIKSFSMNSSKKIILTSNTLLPRIERRLTLCWRVVSNKPSTLSIKNMRTACLAFLSFCQTMRKVWSWQTSESQISWISSRSIIASWSLIFKQKYWAFWCQHQESKISKKKLELELMITSSIASVSTAKLSNSSRQTLKNSMKSNQTTI